MRRLCEMRKPIVVIGIVLILVSIAWFLPTFIYPGLGLFLCMTCSIFFIMGVILVVKGLTLR